MGFFGRPETLVLLVCTANICRSPMGAGVLRYELQQLGLDARVKVDSAGTHATQPGHGADPRARKLCAREGIELGRCQARQVKQRDFSRFDHILAMDRRNQQWLLEQAPDPLTARISLLSSWATGGNLVDIPDPYYGNLAGFERVLEMLRDSIHGFVSQLEEQMLQVRL